jgi:lipid-A-disaccharide synthase-like uncharacterized protein
MTPSLLWIGTLGVIAVETSYVPQILRLHKLKQAEELSFFFPVLNLLGRALALTYALGNHENVFSRGLIIGITLRAIFFAQVVYYRRFAAAKPRTLVALATGATP